MADTEKVYRWHRKGTHRVRDEHRARFLRTNPQKNFSTGRVVWYPTGPRLVKLTTHADNGPEAKRIFDKLVADMWVENRPAMPKFGAKVNR